MIWFATILAVLVLQPKSAPAESKVRLEDLEGPHRHCGAPGLGAERRGSLSRARDHRVLRRGAILPHPEGHLGAVRDKRGIRRWRRRGEQRRSGTTRGKASRTSAAPWPTPSKDPDRRATQMFINLKDNAATHDLSLQTPDNAPFVVFGEVVQGMDVADALSSDYGEAAGGGINIREAGSGVRGRERHLKRSSRSSITSESLRCCRASRRGLREGRVSIVMAVCRGRRR